MYDPESRYPRSSFVQSVADPGTAPTDAPLYCFKVNASWVPYLVGCIMQLAQPPAWATSSADLLGRVQDLIALVGTSGACVDPQLKLDPVDCILKLSLDGGVTWTAVTDWATEFPLCVRANQARVVMEASYSDPPIPQLNALDTDWLYSPDP
jgi:hypothetical protein